ncbi:hypothetical protein K8S19_07480 [bacterium]|nr:hypothetical protein [bacterium]
MKDHSQAGWFYFTGFIGAMVYFIGQADGFWPSVLGIVKAAIWPAFLIYKVFLYIS